MPTTTEAQFRAEFDLDESLVYLNAANQSICPRVVREALGRYGWDYERNPTRGLAQAWGHLWRAQTRLAGFLGADPRDLFLRSNVTSVLNTFLLGAPLAPGGEILVGELEYGAIANICRLRAEREQRSLRILKMPATRAALRQLTPEGLADLVISQLGLRTRLCLLSHVLAGTGLVLPIAEIAAETRRRGIVLVVDGAYAPGAIPVDFSTLWDVDFYGCSLYKWMLGPKGTAFGWVARRHQQTLQPLGAGWSTFEAFGPFEAHGEGNRFQERFLMTGCHDFAPFRAIEDTLDLWDRWGPTAVRERMQALRERLEQGITRHFGWQRLRAGDPKLNGPLMAFRLPARLQADGAGVAARLLREQRIQANGVWLRGGWHLVFSPHVHNSDSEMEAVVDRLRNV